MGAVEQERDDGGHTVGYGTPVNATGVSVRETLGNGFVSKVEVRDTGGVFHEVFSGPDPSQPGAPADFTVTFPTTSYKVDAVRGHSGYQPRHRQLGRGRRHPPRRHHDPTGGGLVTTFDVAFPTQTADGNYTLRAGPNVTDLSGNPMAAAYTAAFTIDRTGPRAVAVVPAGDVNPPLGTFDVSSPRRSRQELHHGRRQAGQAGHVVNQCQQRHPRERHRVPRRLRQPKAPGTYTLSNWSCRLRLRWQPDGPGRRRDQRRSDGRSVHVPRRHSRGATYK